MPYQKITIGQTMRVVSESNPDDFLESDDGRFRFFLSGGNLKLEAYLRTSQTPTILWETHYDVASDAYAEMKSDGHLYLYHPSRVFDKLKFCSKEIASDRRYLDNVPDAWIHLRNDGRLTCWSGTGFRNWAWARGPLESESQKQAVAPLEPVMTVAQLAIDTTDWRLENRFGRRIGVRDLDGEYAALAFGETMHSIMPLPNTSGQLAIGWDYHRFDGSDPPPIRGEAVEVPAHGRLKFLEPGQRTFVVQPGNLGLRQQEVVVTTC